MIKFNPFERKAKHVGLHPGAYEESLVKESISLRMVNYSTDSFEDVTSTTDFKSCLSHDDTITLMISNEGVNEELVQAVNSKIDVGAIHLENLSVGIGKASIKDFDQFAFAELPFFKIGDNRLFQLPIRILFWGSYVLVVSETKEVDFENIIARIVHSKGRVRKMGADYLFFIVIDYLLDQTTTLMNDYNNRISVLEDKEELGQQEFPNLLNLRRQLLRISSDYFSFQNELKKYTSLQPELISKKAWPYFDDLSHHVGAFLMKTDILINRTESIKDLHITNISLKSNSIMQLLTVLSTIFLPITFLTGVYGMNFENIPELKFQYGYYVLLSVCISISIGLLIYFKRKKWL